MLKAVLIDLDNTMVLYDEAAFYLRYFEKIAPRFADLWSPPELQQRMIAAVGALGANDGSRSNREAFIDAFVDGSGLPADDVWNRFIDFYRNDYDRIEKKVIAPAGLHEVLDRLYGIGLTLVVATNPIFPLMVQEKRLAWVDLKPADFALTTHMENSAFVKPRTGYYRRICRALGLSAAECLMVGNDAVNDMAAARIGMRTYLTTEAGPIDYRALGPARRRSAGASADIPAPDFHGPFASVMNAVERLMR